MFKMKIKVDSERTAALLKLVLNTFGSQNGTNNVAIEFEGTKENVEAMDIAVDMKRAIEIEKKK